MKKCAVLLMIIFLFVTAAVSYAKTELSAPNRKLLDAAEDGHLSEALAALAEGADVNAKGYGDDTPLMEASKKGRVEMVKLLLAKGADVNAKDNSGKTALMIASKSVLAFMYRGGYTEVVKLLLDKGAHVNAWDDKGYTALMWAVAGDSEKDRVEIVKLLLAAGADVNAKKDGAWTPLIEASYYGHTEIVRLLLAKGADVKPQDRDGYTALHYASQKGHTVIEQLLLAGGAEEARRYMDRGQAAVETAKTPEDYELAIKEFEQAVRFAPNLPEPYYNLGVLQEKTGKYGDAVANLKQYLRLAPDAGDAEEVKSLINKLEYRQEQNERSRTIDSLNAKVTEVKLYEGGYNGPPKRQRSYRTSFSRTATRYVYYELNLKHPMPFMRKDFTIESVWFNPSGHEIFRKNNQSYIKDNWTSSHHTSGYGWRQTSSSYWSSGAYRVDLYVNGKKIASEKFTIY